MDEDDAREILLGSGGQTVRIGGPISQAIEATLAWNERLGRLYDAREAEVLELLRDQNSLRRERDTLAAEVESLRAAVARVRGWSEDRQVWAVHGSYMDGYQGARRDVARRLGSGDPS